MVLLGSLMTIILDDTHAVKVLVLKGKKCPQILCTMAIMYASIPSVFSMG